MAVIINGTSGITNVNGSASTPAETGLTTNTGIYYGTNTVGLATNGTNALFIDASQNVGINTSSPSTYGKFAVAGQSSLGVDQADYVNVLGASGTARVETSGSSANSNLAFSTKGTGAIYFWRGGYGTTISAIIDGSGNVGIGTSSPGELLHIYKASGDPAFKVQSSAGNCYVVNRAATSAMDLLNSMNGPITFGTNNIERMRIDSSGNVGINITTPSTYGRLAVDTPTGGNGVFSINNSVGGGGGAQASFYYQSFKFAYMDATLENGTPGTQAGRLVFATSTGGTLAERMRIDSSGNLLVNATAQSSAERVNITVNGSAQENLILVNTNTSAGTNTAIGFRRPSATTVGTITTTLSATAYNTSSDYRLKENIQPMTGALAKVSELKPVTYTWKSTGEAGEGFIAHELQTVVPDCVTGAKDAVDTEGNPVYQGIDTSFLVATLTAAIQEQQAIIQQLQADVATLKGQA